MADFGHFKLHIYDQYTHQKHSCSWSLKLIFSGFEVLMSTSKLQSMSFELRLEIFLDDISGLTDLEFLAGAS